jgi:four helix bundle protein
VAVDRGESLRTGARKGQHAVRLAVECAKAAKRFPKEEQTALADQLRRSAHSVPLNIAEGSSRKGSKEFRRFLDVARGSLSEVQTALEIARSMEYISPDDFHLLDDIATETAKTLWGLLRKVGGSLSH